MLNLILYFIATAIDALPISSGMGHPIILMPVLIFTTGGGIVVAILYPDSCALSRPLTRQHDLRDHRFTGADCPGVHTAHKIPEPTISVVLMLEVMPMVVGMPVMYTLTKMS